MLTEHVTEQCLLQATEQGLQSSTTGEANTEGTQEATCNGRNNIQQSGGNSGDGKNYAHRRDATSYRGHNKECGTSVKSDNGGSTRTMRDINRHGDSGTLGPHTNITGPSSRKKQTEREDDITPRTSSNIDINGRLARRPKHEWMRRPKGQRRGSRGPS
jgi:hypothetical protein